MKHPSPLTFIRFALSLAFVALSPTLLNAAERKVNLAGADAAAQWNFVRGQWAVQDGALIQTDPKIIGSLARLKDANYADCDFRVAFRASSGGGVRVPQVTFRVQGDDTYYYLHLDSRGENVRLVLHLPEQPYNVIATAKAKLPLDEWHQARVVCEGPGIRVYLDDMLLLDKLDSTFLGGGIGLGTSQGHVEFKDIAISGQALPAENMQTYKPAPFSVVCADAGAGGDEEFPDVARLSNGELIVTFYAGYSHGSKPGKTLPKGGRLAFVKSKDNGKTWSAARTLFDSAEDDRDPSIVEVSPGRLLCNFFTYHYPDPAKEVLATSETHVVESLDFGETWGSKPVPVPSPFDGPCCSTSDPIRKLPDGTLLMPVYGYHKAKPYLWIPALVRSKDDGKTWGDPTIIVENHPTILPEPAFCLLPDGRIICHIRPDMVQCYSSDAGRTWTKPEKLPFIGDAPYLLRTSKGVLLSAFRHPGTSIAWSPDDGKTWHGPQRLDLTSGAYPSLVEMPDGRVLMIYYTGGVRSDIRAQWLEVTGEGVRALPLQANK